MICTKCNSIIPDEAKFCPSCGADCKPAAQTAPKANHCTKCGLELENSAKFCPVCGTAVNSVSLDKQPDSDSLVSAMPSSVPTPTAVAAPTIGTAPYAPPADASPNSFGAPAPMPQYTPPTDGFGDMGNMGAVGSAAAVVPVKKKNGAKVAIIIAAAVVVLLAATAIFFFTNKATFLSTFMGKTKYAAMVEGNSIKETVNKIDASAISTGVKSASGFYGSLAAANSADTIMPTSYNAYATAYGKRNSFDVSTLFKPYNQFITETYGTDAIKVTALTEINLSDSAKAAIGGDDVTKVLDIINGTTFTYDLAASENAMGVQFGTEGKLTVNAKILLTEDGSYYLAVPFASDKALMFKIDSDNAQAASKTVTLELDEKEISRLIEEIVKIYIAHYEKAVTDMGSGSLTIDGEEVSGKLISADFSGDAMSEMIKEMINHIGEDEYFANKIVDFVKECGGELTLDEYKKAFEDAANDVELSNSGKFSVKTVINNNGDVLAKSYAINAEGKLEFAYKGDEKDFAAEFIYELDDNSCIVKFTNTENSLTGSCVTKSNDDTFTMKIDCVKTDSNSGNAVITFQKNNDGEYGFDVTYALGKAKCFTREVCTGTVSVTIHMPKNVNSLDNELLTVLDGMQIEVFNTATENSQNTTFTVKTTTYGDMTVQTTISATDKGDLLTVPDNVIDLTGVSTGSLDANTQNQLTEFQNELMDALKKIDIFSASIPDLSGQGGVGTITPGIGNNDNWNLNNDSHANDDFTYMTAEELNELSTDYVIRFMTVSAYADNNPELESKLYDAQDILNNMSNYMTSYNSQSAQGTIDVSMLREWRKALKKFVIIIEECESLVTAGGNAPAASHANDDFSSMSFEELDELFDEYIDRRFDLSLYPGDGDRKFTDMLTAVNETYAAAHDYWFDYCYVYDYNDAATLNGLRNSVRDFVIAVEACEALID